MESPDPLPTSAPARPSRRSVLGAGLGAGAVALLVHGCAVPNPLESDAATPVDEALPTLEPDVAIAVEAVVAIRAVQGLLETATAQSGRKRAELRRETAGWQRMHAAHLDALTGAIPASVDLDAAGSDAADRDVRITGVHGTRGVAVAEDGLRLTMRGLALRAESGPFARLLGAIAAAIAQRLAASP